MGEGELRAEIEKQINELNLEKDIFLMGFQSNVYKYLKLKFWFSLHYGKK